MAVHYFVSRDPDGSVSHLVRVAETDDAIGGEYFQSGRWIVDGSVSEYLFDRTLGEEVSAGEAATIEAALTADVTTERDGRVDDE
jgi:hypothetical protein